MTKVAPAREAYCQRPNDCVAGKRARCMLCQPIGPEELARRRSAMKRNYADPEYRERITAAVRSPEVRAQMAESARERWRTWRAARKGLS